MYDLFSRCKFTLYLNWSCGRQVTQVLEVENEINS